MLAGAATFVLNGRTAERARLFIDTLTIRGGFSGVCFAGHVFFGSTSPGISWLVHIAFGRLGTLQRGP